MNTELSQENTSRYIPREGQQNDERFIAAVEDITRMKNDRVMPILRWFKTHVTLPRILFRVSGTLIILLSVSLPLLSIVEGPSRDTLLPIVALMIAGLTGLNSFFQWQNAWQGRRQTQRALEYLLSHWELEMIKAKQHPEPQKAIQLALEATERLLDRTKEVTAAETSEFFQGIQLPQSQ
jgi:hypothetical protein